MDEFLSEIGGPEQVARDLVEHFKKHKAGKQAQQLFRMVLESIKDEDNARLTHNHIEEVSESRERAYVMEYVLSNRLLLEEINAAAHVRGMLPAPEEEPLEVEFAKI